MDTISSECNLNLYCDEVPRCQKNVFASSEPPAIAEGIRSLKKSFSTLYDEAKNLLRRFRRNKNFVDSKLLTSKMKMAHANVKDAVHTANDKLREMNVVVESSLDTLSMRDDVEGLEISPHHDLYHS